MVRIFHFRKKCIGCYYCVEIAPNRWHMDEKDGKSLLNEAKENKGIYMVEVPDFEYEENKQAADACPVNCIRVEKF